MRQTRMFPMGSGTFRIHIDRQDDGGLRGKLTGGGASGVLEFSSLSRMILLIDSLLDAGMPGAPPTAQALPEPPNFELQILFRQNCSWQGRLVWLEEGKEAAFRSVLELLELLETILSK